MSHPAKYLLHGLCIAKEKEGKGQFRAQQPELESTSITIATTGAQGQLSPAHRTKKRKSKFNERMKQVETGNVHNFK